jgi:hypothetical protein
MQRGQPIEWAWLVNTASCNYIFDSGYNALPKQQSGYSHPTTVTYAGTVLNTIATLIVSLRTQPKSILSGSGTGQDHYLRALAAPHTALNY